MPKFALFERVLMARAFGYVRALSQTLGSERGNFVSRVIAQDYNNLRREIALSNPNPIALPPEVPLPPAPERRPETTLFEMLMYFEQLHQVFAVLVEHEEQE